MKHSVTPLVGGKPVRTQDYDQRSLARVSESCAPCISCGRPFETYTDQPDTAERTRLAVQAIPFALPEPRSSFEYGKPFGLGHKPDCPCNYCANKPALPEKREPPPLGMVRDRANHYAECRTEKRDA